MMTFNFKKKLGQHFLIDNAILEKIVENLDLTNKHVIEVGPGKGNLTEKILKKKPSKVYLIEMDRTLEPFLKNIIKKYHLDVKILFQDATKLQLYELINEEIILVANLPYNIATTLIISWFKYIKCFSSLTVMVQKEVAQRLTAEISSKFYGRLSVLARLHANIEKMFDVEPDSFFPKPKVNSSVIRLTPKKVFDFNYEKLDRTLKICFTHRRKILKNNLRKTPENVKLEKKMRQNNINPYLRPQELSPKDFINLSEILLY